MGRPGNPGDMAVGRTNAPQTKKGAGRLGGDVRPDISPGKAPGGEEWRVRAGWCVKGGGEAPASRVSRGRGGVRRTRRCRYRGDRCYLRCHSLILHCTISRRSHAFFAWYWPATQHRSLILRKFPSQPMKLRQAASHIEGLAGHAINQKIPQCGNAQGAPQFGGIGEEGAEHRPLHLWQHHLHPPR